LKLPSFVSAGAAPPALDDDRIEVDATLLAIQDLGCGLHHRAVVAPPDTEMMSDRLLDQHLGVEGRFVGRLRTQTK
jgi:hypothetical protein